jgi:hypothetical protein
MPDTAASPLPPVATPLEDARILQARIEGLRSLLNMQLRQIEALNERIQPSTPAGRAASRMQSLKWSR